MMPSERDYQLHPVVQDSVIHNSKVREPATMYIAPRQTRADHLAPLLQ